MVDEKRLLEQFRTLAGFDSESFHEKDISEYLYKKLIDLGLEVTMDDAGHKLRENEKATGNIYGFLKGNKDGEPILLSAHMDTVAPGNGKKIIVHEDGLITSDGTTVLGSDDLTGVVAILETLEVIKEKKLPHPDIEVIFFVAEELYGMGSAVFDYSKVKAKQAYVFDLDGQIGTIANCAPTIILFEAEFIGKSSHAGFAPEQGISAILAASRAIPNLNLGRLDAETTANVGIIQGGTGVNVVPGTTLVKGEVRSTNHERALSEVEGFKKVFEEAAAFYGAKLQFHYEVMVHAYRIEENAKVITRYADAMKALGMGDINIVTTFGGSDNNNFCLYDIEGIVVSNGMHNVHTKEEYFHLSELVKSTEIVIELVCHQA